ncbi:MAG: heme utilization cystosolic carrier protein HutX [Pseudomonadales bacterium]|nr:heme utilization cystosolic carrier protein HutX [Pseudomonadales bacterium]
MLSLSKEVVMTNQTVLPGDKALDLLQELSSWGKLRTIIIHAGCVFEFGGVFPPGEIGSGYYNLHAQEGGFEGHINLDKIDHIAFQDAMHRGRQAYAFVFNTENAETIFKVFLGRDNHGELFPQQVLRFKAIQSELTL